MTQYRDLSEQALRQLEMDLLLEHRNFVERELSLDLTRGKPSAEQVSVSDELDGILAGNFKTESGVDVRNYGGLDGIKEMKKLAGVILDAPAENVLIGGNSSLSLMHQVMSMIHFYGKDGILESENHSWQSEYGIKFLCPVPGYDRHFTICETLGIQMMKVRLNDDGPDMDQIESLVQEDPSIKGIWCVPKYSNPTGVTYSNEVVERMAKLPKISGPNFAIMWDNAYAVHDLSTDGDELKSLWKECEKEGTTDSVYMFGSTSKITYPGAGVGFLAASNNNLAGFKKYISALTIGPDKVNQLRHVKLLKDIEMLKLHMKKHAGVIGPKFQTVLKKLEPLKELGIANWTEPRGGYFISLDTKEFLAQRVVELAGQAGVKLTPAGATFPYRNDPTDQNIRIAPTFPSLEDLELAMDVFVTCLKLATIESLVNEQEKPTETE